MREFRNKPDFARRYDIETPFIAEGTFVDVFGMEVPEKVRKETGERIPPKDLVVKRYAGADEYFLFGIDEIDLEQKRAILCNRYKAVRDIFANDLPDLVLKTSVTVANDVGGEDQLYEIQQKVLDYKDPFDIPRQAGMFWDRVKFINSIRDEDQRACEWVEDITKEMECTGADMKQLGNELKKFVDLSKNFGRSKNKEAEGKFLDIKGKNNLVVAKEGLRLIDTNYLLDIEGDHEVYQVYLAQLSLLEKVAKKILEGLK